MGDTPAKTLTTPLAHSVIETRESSNHGQRGLQFAPILNLHLKHILLRANRATYPAACRGCPSPESTGSFSLLPPPAVPAFPAPSQLPYWRIKTCSGALSCGWTSPVISSSKDAGGRNVGDDFRSPTPALAADLLQLKTCFKS